MRAAAMGGSGSRLSKELLAEYQVRETPVPREFARGLRSGEDGPRAAAGRVGAASGPGRPADPPLSFCLPGLDVPDQTGDPSVSAVSNLTSRMLSERLRERGRLRLTDGQTEVPPAGGAGACMRPAAEPELQAGAPGPQLCPLPGTPSCLAPAAPAEHRGAASGRSWVLFDPAPLASAKRNFLPQSGRDCCSSGLLCLLEKPEKLWGALWLLLYLNTTVTVNAY